MNRIILTPRHVIASRLLPRLRGDRQSVSKGTCGACGCHVVVVCRRGLKMGVSTD